MTHLAVVPADPRRAAATALVLSENTNTLRPRNSSANVASPTEIAIVSKDII